MHPLERAARAAAEQYGEDWDSLPDVNPIANGELDKAHFFEQARAVLSAVRELAPSVIDMVYREGVWNCAKDEIGSIYSAATEVMLAETTMIANF